MVAFSTGFFPDLLLFLQYEAFGHMQSENCISKTQIIRFSSLSFPKRKNKKTSQNWDVSYEYLIF
jgi:hypothetical protein